MSQKELTLENMTDKLNKKTVAMFDRFTDDEILFLFRVVDIQDIIMDAFDDRLNDVRNRRTYSVMEREE